MKITITSALAALTLVAGLSAGQAQAHTEWRYPFKSAPYAVPHTYNDKGTTAPRMLKQKAIRKSQRSFVANDAAIVVAHHKPPYHDGLPRTPSPANPQTNSTSKPRTEAGNDRQGSVFIG